MSLIRRIRPEKTGVRAPLGDLEMAVMRHVWNCGPEGCPAVEVQQVLERERPTAITTVLTTLERLRDKGILVRERAGKAYRYRAAITEEQLQRRIVEGVLNDLIAQFPGAVAAYFTQQGLAPGKEEEQTRTLAELSQRLQTLRAGEADTAREAGTEESGDA